jgi:hypothetical protein
MIKINYVPPSTLMMLDVLRYNRRFNLSELAIYQIFPVGILIPD